MGFEDGLPGGVGDLRFGFGGVFGAIRGFFRFENVVADGALVGALRLVARLASLRVQLGDNGFESGGRVSPRGFSEFEDERFRGRMAVSRSRSFA